VKGKKTAAPLRTTADSDVLPPSEVVKALKPHPQQQEYVQALRKSAQKYLKVKNVTSVGVGYKISDGKQTNQLCIQFTVAQKLAPETLAAEGIPMLPESITAPDGTEIPVDVIERKFEPGVVVIDPRAEAARPRRQRRTRLNPVLPGISVSHIDGTAGTLGGIVIDEETGDPMILSNWHVLAGSEAGEGDIVLQPGPFDGGDLTAVTGKLRRSHLGLAGDCAVCSIDRSFERRILDLDIAPLRIGKADLGDKVVKSGRTTGVTFGVVSRVGVVSKIFYEGKGEVEIGGFEIVVNPDKRPGGGEISKGGDSGSFWMMDDPALRDVVVGLHFAGEVDPSPDEYALACNIHSVLEKLRVRLPAEGPGDIARAHRALGFQGKSVSTEAAEAAPEDLTELPPLDLKGIQKIEDMLASDPDGLLEMVRDTLDPKVDEATFRHGLDRARAMLRNPARFAPELRALEGLEAVALPPDFTFPGMDLSAIPIDPDNRQFEDLADLARWIIFAGGTIIFGSNKEPFRGTSAATTQFPMIEPLAGAPVQVALFSDFGTGLYHSRYIAKQIANRKPAYAIHCGDVYYAGRESEFEKHVKEPLNPILGDTRLFMLNSNHEMFSGGKWYFAFLDEKRASHPAMQQQVGSLFSVSSNKFQLVGIDTAYHKNGRFKDDDIVNWLRARLVEGRTAGKINILFSANEPYKYGDDDLTKLCDKDLKDMVQSGLIDLWFWGNTHYCGLFDRAPRTPFIGSCIGHGGFPGGVQKSGQEVPAPLLFLETRTRFPASTNLRKDMGNNGFCMMTLREDGTIGLQYFDWMSNTRCQVEIGRDAADGAVRVLAAPVFG